MCVGCAAELLFASMWMLVYVHYCNTVWMLASVCIQLMHPFFTSLSLALFVFSVYQSTVASVQSVTVGTLYQSVDVSIRSVEDFVAFSRKVTKP